MKDYIPNISGFADFCKYHSDGSPIFWVNNRLHAGLDMLQRLDTRYNFIFPDTRVKIEEAIQRNLYMFDFEPTRGFYYPNDNMFSGNNSESYIKGYILTLNKKYCR